MDQLAALETRVGVEVPEPEKIGAFCLQLGIVAITYNGVPIPMPGKEVRFLGLLLTKPGTFFSRTEIMRTVWPEWGNNYNTHTVETTKHRVCERLKKYAPGVTIKANSRGGYAILLPN